MRLPLIRVGLLLIVGAVLASMFTFYIGLGESFASMTGEVPPTERPALWGYFRDHFLFAGTVPGMLFWLGCAVCVVGVVRIRSSRRGRRGRREEPPQSR